ncbi:transcription elongation factor GreA [Arthrobacter echini]|uniref:Transcription elongation factor GreA n=1 Tax=Arthrobacter echini TaxID=1529066 RepID=A0A4S5E5V7_9MICC|nr:GreA/GreB family elongation factor [Arthrobacter echini]THJ66840.1 transcription elongation factor GreA [Arthrobacter echini]
MTHPAASVTWLTPQVHARLQAELDGLMAARGGQESAERVAVEARIRQVMTVLKDARMHEPADDGVVEPGMLVTAVIDGEPEEFLMGSREIFGDSDLNVFSERSPLGLAIHGLKPGETSSYPTPRGRTVSVSVVSATPYAGSDIPS